MLRTVWKPPEALVTGHITLKRRKSLYENSCGHLCPAFRKEDCEKNSPMLVQGL